MSYESFYRTATGHHPFPYQVRLAEMGNWPARIEIPTGLGKTEAVLVAWLWRRRESSATREQTPRRLVYCLPMRVLVEQTLEVITKVLAHLGRFVRVVTLMGGVNDGVSDNTGDRWDIHPEQDTIVVGTQDMLLSRALNRGYGMSRYRWPLHFGLLNTDCLWIVDEVQLVGSGVSTTTQLQALRRKLGTLMPTRTVWMSATLDESWLRSIDVNEMDVAGRLVLEKDDRAHTEVAKRIGAQKKVLAAQARMGNAQELAAEIIAVHRAGTRTLVILNTVERARQVFAQLTKLKPSTTLTLLHSRFRAADRARAVEAALATPLGGGSIVVSTQVIEAGLDLSSTTLFTEIAPWASLVQRFGRCNRRGDDDGATVRWIGLPEDEKARAAVEKPYALAEMIDAQETISALASVGSAALPEKKLPLKQGLTLRRRDLLDLFDTTPDLMGNDVDVSRFIRDSDDQDVRVFWRAIQSEPDPDEPFAFREEICTVPINVARQWLSDKRLMWAWDGLHARWSRADRIYPGLTLMLRVIDGGYDAVIGLDPKSRASVAPAEINRSEPVPKEARSLHDEPESECGAWYSLAQHSEDVAQEALSIAEQLALPTACATALTTAGRWHDAGKAHNVWQSAARQLGDNPPAELIAKSDRRRGHFRFEGRQGFRHELASALLALQNGQSDLVCFLIACHHGKVRCSLRAEPLQRDPDDEPIGDALPVRYARGIREGDTLPAIDLGGGLIVPETRLTLSYMELGDDELTGPSWTARVLALRDHPGLGPFRLAFLEGLIKCADERASAKIGAERKRS